MCETAGDFAIYIGLGVFVVFIAFVIAFAHMLPDYQEPEE